MDSRKSLMHKRLEAIQNSSTSSTSSTLLRRKSIAKTPESTLSENDDEAERLARRREISATTPLLVSSNNKRHSLGLGFLANISEPQMAESINQCIKLSTENKINAKNAFALGMIDFMTYMIKKQDVNMSNLQVASTSLDVSTKIYGFRVDSVHMEILKMVGGLDKHVDDAEQNLDEQREATTEDMEANIEMQKKKKKKAKQKIFSTMEALRGNIEIAKPLSMMIGEGDLQTSDMLYQACLPNHANSGFYQHPYNDVLVDVLEDTSESQSNSNVKYTIPTIEDFSNLEICASYSNFEFLGWSVDNEPEEMSDEGAESNDDDNRFQFDLDASMEQDNEPAPEPMNFFDIEGDDNNENNIQRCYREKTSNPNGNIVDALDVRPSATSEYSFVQSSINLHWAGPSHWKFRNLARPFTDTAAGSIKETAAGYTQAKLSKRKQFELSYDDKHNVDEKFASSHSNKLQAKTAKTEWSTENVTLPEDVHYDVMQLCKLYVYQKMIIKPSKNGNNENEVITADMSDAERYDYDNPNDTLEYCPNVEHDGDYDDYGGKDDGTENYSCEDDNAIVTGSQGLIGDNLVAAPKLVNKIAIPYCLKAKRIDMRQLKKSIWSCLTESTNNNNNTDVVNIEETANEADKMKDNKRFSDIYKKLPKLLTKNNAEALSVPISFISMLHLANEKELKINSLPDLSDIIIESGDSPK
ncbi:LOW QUALITY PROTEIN: condensin complex subunit 2 [Pogonomyrmex barbatus]|uniref:Condensin complex subunit 2 n=1 Tax=Pogonomyrmex barbatus TaxID=144034 RepID=A0A6I9X187_9HYME|nr:LOW QUALITY PROTEIN: condensin complex subunit 2 [Pogonomyrmex barbatus]